MEDFERISSQICQKTDIHTDLSRNLEMLRQQSPERFSTPIYVLDAVDDTVDGRFEESLQQASRYSSGKKIILIPCHLGNFHWIGILIEFDSKEQIERSEFIDPVKGSNVVPDKLQKQFAKIFPNKILRSRTFLEDKDETKSAVLTVANLLSAVQNTQSPQMNIQDKESSHNSNSNNKKLSTYLPDEEQQYGYKDQVSFSTPTSTISNQGNLSKLQVLEKTLSSGLVRMRITETNMLSEKIQRAEQRIQEYQEEGRIEEIEKEQIYLTECRLLQKLSEEIHIAKSDVSKSYLHELEQKLVSGLSKLNISDATKLAEKVLRSEQRIKEYREEGRVEEAEKEKDYLNKLNKLGTLNEEIASLKMKASSIPSDNTSNLHELEQKLVSGLSKLNISDATKLAEKVLRSEQRIKEYQEEGRTEETEKEQQHLRGLKVLMELSDKIRSLKPGTPNTDKSDELKSVKSNQELPKNTVSMSTIAEKKNLEDLDILHQDWTDMPSCAEKSVMQLLEVFQRLLLRSNEMSSESQVSVKEILSQLKCQIRKQELFSEKIQENLIDVERYIQSGDVSSTVRALGELLTKIRPLHVQEIQRLVEKAKVAGKLIHGKEIILLIGETGTGKSTTIQFLAGCKMKKTKIEVEPGRFLEHITADGPITNPGLKNVTSSARNKSETRYIAPVTISLKDIFGPSGFGEIILCDAPGFGDTAGPEVDIANGVGVIEAIKGCKSVKILALSSYKSLGDRGQGIQRLAHLLINMVHGIEERLNAILYVFTKYPDIDISATLIDIKSSKVETDPLLRSDSGFVTVLTDMINKTKSGTENIDPVRSDPKNIIENLKNIRGIMYPGEVFRFSMSEETQACIANQGQRDNSSAKCAVKHKDIDLVMYYLNKLKVLKDLLEHSAVQDAYEDAIRFVAESISEFCTGVTKKFNRALASQDGLGKEDIDEYKSADEYIRQIQKLTTHLGQNLVSPESLMQNIHSELHKRSQDLTEEDLHSPLVGIYFGNLCILKNAFKQLESFYSKSCESFSERFEKLEQSFREPLYTNEFSKVAEIILKVWKCLPTLNSHLHGLVEKKYKSIVQSLLQHLSSFVEKANPILVRIRLSETELGIIKDYVEILKSAKDNSALQDRISTYVEMLTQKNDKSAENVKSVSDTYNALIEKIMNYFSQINSRISELFQSSGDRALEDTETLVIDMDAIRTIPEIESKTAGVYYRAVESIRGHMQQLQRDVDQLLYPIDLQSGTINYGKIARLLSRLKNAKWMNRVSPGAYDVSINRVTDELVQYFHQLEDSLMKLDLNLKYPENVCVAEGIFEKIESLSVLERIVPELKTSKDAMIQRFLESVQENFDRIQKSFNLQDITVYQMKQELKELEQIKREYENLHPACIFLRKHDFSDVNKLNEEIADLEKKKTIELEQETERKSKIEAELNGLKSMIQQYDHSHHSEVDQGKSEKEQTNKRSKSVGNSSIDTVRKSVVKSQDRLNDQLEIIQEKHTKYNNSLSPLKLIRKQYECLLATPDSISPEQITLLQEKRRDSIQLIIEIIEEKSKVIAERQKNKQSYDFNNRFDASTADIALLYTINCGKIANVLLKGIATDTHEILKKYISEYGYFIDDEIERLFIYLTTISSQTDLSQDFRDLETRLEQLSSLSEFKNVFAYIEGTKKVVHWRRKFSVQFDSVSGMMAEYKASTRTTELREQLTIAKGLMGSDHFCGGALLSSGFGALYRQYQVEATKESKQAYRSVLDCISRDDYVNADKALADVDEKTSNPKDIDQIKYDLQSCLKNLIQSTRKIVVILDPKIDFKENNEVQIHKIDENSGKIRTVLSKPRLMGLIDEKTKPDLMHFEEIIKIVLSDMLLKGLTFIENFMNTDDVFEAEQSMENLVLVLRELTGHFTMEDVTEKISTVKQSLDNLANDISKRYDFNNIENYHTNPPRDFLAKLKKAVPYRSGKYDTVHTRISAEIQRNFETAIHNACEAPIEKRSAQMRPLHSALRYLPEDLEKEFKPQVDEFSKKFAEDEKAFKRELKGFLESDDIDETTLKKMNKHAVEYEQQKRYEALGILRSGVMQKLENHWKNVQSVLGTEDVQSATKSMRQIINYKEHVHNLSEVDEFYKRICVLISTNVTNYTETLNNIFKIEKTETVDQAFINMIIYIELAEDFPSRMRELLPGKVLKNVEIGLKNMYDNWLNIPKTFHTAMTELDIKSLYEVTCIMERWDGFLNKTINCYCRHDLIQSFSNNMKNIILYAEMISELEKKIIVLKKNINAELTSDETTRFEAIRDQFFSNLAMSLKALKSISSEFKNTLLSKKDVEKLEKELKEKVEDIEQKLLVYASQDDLSQSESDSFRMCYNHLVSFDKYVRLPEVKIRHNLEVAEVKIFEKVTLLSRTIVSSGSDVTKVAELFAKMKFFAENFSMFDTKINGIIDENLKSYKTQHGASILSQLTMVLEKTDIGSRLISEHSCLSGEDWRKRREKMQKQDDLVYVIGELEGDDLTKDVLCSRYATFRRTYDDLISNILGSFNQKTEAEPNLEVLITQTKILIGTIVQKTNVITWDQSLRDKIPELLAHIFAVWTLKNTQHYNSIRGIEASRAYLLMPHVAQVIAIFRILGIGYKKSTTVLGYDIPLTKRISDDLINNLVQVGTGEGKSVVMAVTACVFALIGVDVDCSCYSEYLSMRDKNDFAPVFRALGIEERIQYGTFNKLCENFLNQQCNVREKVRDMIMNNKNVIDLVQTTARIRPKVLLIDEVDVFLSEKFYGGMYTPSVYLKDPSIKTLLDTLWQNKNVRALNVAKALPAYQACATKFSNWIFLFDEAIKDMLAALQSFQSSTYIVQNDKIVYVEGESVAENAVRGYDTVWAYYYENEKGFISQNSLETNVGIIINCGTFSYAEMPHEFAYITGVTGTLKTLAEPEKSILQQVYKIHKNTFMPSVFGKSNRNYNPANDVEAVKKSEYFMRIRGEIDLMCNAQRAILVFFESEEKLIEFYNSSELSSIKQNVQIITEKVSTKERELCIKRAATDGRVTLLTRTFGRGTDFICRNQQVLANGGVHVLQTFFSEELSEGYQIMGRGARQGDRGSYRMILLDSDLEWVLGPDWEKEIVKITGSTLYGALDTNRNKLYESKCAAKEVGIEQRRREHDASKSFMNALSTGQMDTVKKFLKKQNRGANLVSGSSRTLLLMDATGSMSNLLSAAKDTVCTMFERASSILAEQGLPDDAFQMQFAVYRDYDCKEGGLLQSSSWETKPNNLRLFMANITAKGGDDYEEAIEIGLWHAVEQSEQPNGLSQVILIGDAPAKEKPAINRDRKTSGGKSYWGKTKFKDPTYYIDELEKLKAKNIRVHAFYLAEEARNNFQRIASETSGRCERLNLNSSQGAEMLTNFVTEEVLRITDRVKGNALVDQYRAKYVKTTFTC